LIGLILEGGEDIICLVVDIDKVRVAQKEWWVIAFEEQFGVLGDIHDIGIDGARSDVESIELEVDREGSDGFVVFVSEERDSIYQSIDLLLKLEHLFSAVCQKLGGINDAH